MPENPPNRQTPNSLQSGEPGEREYSASTQLRTTLLTLSYQESTQLVADLSIQKELEYSPIEDAVLWQTLEGRDVEDIAQDLGWRPHSVSTTQFRVFEKIAERLNDQDKADLAARANQANEHLNSLVRDLRNLSPGPRAVLVWELLQAAERTPDKPRQTIYLVHVEHHEYDETAELMGASPSTVARRLRRGYAAIGRYISPDLANRIETAKAEETEEMVEPPYTPDQIREILQFRSPEEKAGIIGRAMQLAGDALPRLDRYILWEELVKERQQIDIAAELKKLRSNISESAKRALSILSWYLDDDVAEQFEQEKIAAEAPKLQPRPNRDQITEMILQVPTDYREYFMQQLSRRAKGVSTQGHQLMVSTLVQGDTINEAWAKSTYKSVASAANAVTKVFTNYAHAMTEADLETIEYYKLAAIQAVGTANLHEQEYLICRLIEQIPPDDARQQTDVGELQAQRLERALERMYSRQVQAGEY